jgi:hypothetical protein
MKFPRYHIFSGRYGTTDVLWRDSVEGFGSANERMKELAAHEPGPYFVFCTEKHAILASIDTSTASDIREGRELG